jgi:hypothetical protein
LEREIGGASSSWNVTKIKLGREVKNISLKLLMSSKTKFTKHI